MLGYGFPFQWLPPTRQTDGTEYLSLYLVGGRMAMNQLWYLPSFLRMIGSMAVGYVFNVYETQNIGG